MGEPNLAEPPLAETTVGPGIDDAEFARVLVTLLGSLPSELRYHAVWVTGMPVVPLLGRLAMSDSTLVWIDQRRIADEAGFFRVAGCRVVVTSQITGEVMQLRDGRELFPSQPRRRPWVDDIRPRWDPDRRGNDPGRRHADFETSRRFTEDQLTVLARLHEPLIGKPSDLPPPVDRGWDMERDRHLWVGEWNDPEPPTAGHAPTHDLEHDRADWYGVEHWRCRRCGLFVDAVEADGRWEVWGPAFDEPCTGRPPEPAPWPGAVEASTPVAVTPTSEGGEVDPLTDIEVARLLREHPDVHVAGRAADYCRLGILLGADPPACPEPLPVWCTPGGVFVAETTVDAEGNMWRLWHWKPDAEAWERDARARGKLT